MSLAVMSPGTLSDIAGVSAGVARKAIQASRNLLDLGFTDGLEYAKKRANIINISTGSKKRLRWKCNGMVFIYHSL